MCGGKDIKIDGIGNNKSILSFTAAGQSVGPAAVFWMGWLLSAYDSMTEFCSFQPDLDAVLFGQYFF